jgi:hypothetical protein
MDFISIPFLLFTHMKLHEYLCNIHDVGSATVPTGFGRHGGLPYVIDPTNRFSDRRLGRTVL